jgi:hypothetical protein
LRHAFVLVCCFAFQAQVRTQVGRKDSRVVVARYVPAIEPAPKSGARCQPSAVGVCRQQAAQDTCTHCIDANALGLVTFAQDSASRSRASIGRVWSSVKSTLCDLHSGAS